MTTRLNGGPPFIPKQNSRFWMQSTTLGQQCFRFSSKDPRSGTVTGQYFHLSGKSHAHIQCRIALAFETLTPNQVCAAFGRALGRPCNYVFDPIIQIKVPVPAGYKEQLAGIEVLFGRYNAPYFPGPEFQYPAKGQASSNTAATANRRSSETIRDKPRKLTSEARELWGGYRGIEEYAREVFPLEEEANGKDWMIPKVVST